MKAPYSQWGSPTENLFLIVLMLFSPFSHTLSNNLTLSWCYLKSVHRATLNTQGPFEDTLPNQTCAAMLVCVPTHAKHFAGWEAPTAGKVEISSLSQSFYLRKVYRWAVSPLDVHRFLGGSNQQAALGVLWWNFVPSWAFHSPADDRPSIINPA